MLYLEAPLSTLEKPFLIELLLKIQLGEEKLKNPPDAARLHVASSEQLKSKEKKFICKAKSQEETVFYQITYI